MVLAGTMLCSCERQETPEGVAPSAPASDNNGGHTEALVHTEARALNKKAPWRIRLHEENKLTDILRWDKLSEALRELLSRNDNHESSLATCTLTPEDFADVPTYASQDFIAVDPMFQKNTPAPLPPEIPQDAWLPGRRILIVTPNIIFERSNGHYRSWLARLRAAEAASASPGRDDEEEDEKKKKENKEDQAIASTEPTVEHNIAPSPPTSPRYPMMRSMLRSVALSATDPALDGALIWRGNVSSAWDTRSLNWTQNGTASAFPSAGGTAVVFGNEGINRDINVTGARSVPYMTITHDGYTFSGGGNLTVTNTLDIRVAEVEGTSYDYPATTTFSSANNVTAGSILLRSAENTLTTFGGSVTADSLTISNCYTHGDKAGAYVFNGAVNVSGDFSADLGGAEEDSGASGKVLLTLNGNLSAGDLSLDGASIKNFNGSVTTTGNLSISGIEDSSARDGRAVFAQDVIIGGKKLSISGHSEAVFHGKILTASGGTDAAALQVELNDGLLQFDCFTTYLGGENTYSLGTITLKGEHNELSLGSLTLADAAVIGSSGAGDSLSVSGVAKRLELTLTNIRNLSIGGGAVYLSASDEGQIRQNLTLSHAASVTLESDNLFAGNTEAELSLDGGSLNLGSTTQTLYGSLALANTSSLSASGDGELIANGDNVIHYTGKGNGISATLQTGDGTLTIQATPTDAAASVADTSLSLAGDIQGSGEIHFSGQGETRIESDLSYQGSVQVTDGSVLVLGSQGALAESSGITINSGSGLNIIHNGTGSVLNGEDGLLLENGARLNFTNLSDHGGTPALVLNNGKLLFGGDIIISFDETQEGKKLENLHTYTLVASAAGIDQKPGTTAGSVTVYANGKTTPLSSDQYEFSYMNANGIRYFTFTMLAGKSWCGGASGDWHAMTGSEYDNWTEGAVGDVALFRDQGTDMPNVRIELSKQSSAEGLYMDGATNYTIYADETFTASFATSETPAAFKNTSDLTKKGSGTMTWEGVPLNLSDINLGEGTLALTGGSTLTSTGSITISPAAYDSSGAIVSTAALAIDSSSTVQQGADILSGYNGSTAELRAVSISDGNITGLDSSISGVTSNPSISNARFGIDSTLSDNTKEGTNGYTLSNLTLTGTGSIANTTLSEGITISGTYSLGNAVTVTSTVANTGTITVDPSTTVLGIGRLEDSNGTYTVFTGGSYSGWNRLTEANFHVHGTLLSDISGVEVSTSTNGTVTIDSGNAVILDWDSAWGIDSWDAPTAAIYYNTSSNRSNFNIVSTSGNGNNSNGTLKSTYRYSTLVNGGSSTDYVIYLGENAGGSRYSAYGIAQNAVSQTSESAPANIWIMDEGSNWGTYIAGGTSGTFYGDTHLHITGELSNASTIIGASRNAVQHGDSWLTIEAGRYDSSRDLVVAGSSGSAHYGNSLLHIAGGSFSTVYGGSYNSHTEGDTRVIVSGGTISTIYGGDYNTSTQHTGNVVVDLQGGSISNVYAAGNSGNKVSGTVHVNLYADGSNMLPSITSTLYGGASVTTGSSSLCFMNPGTYSLTGVTIQQFDRFELAAGADVRVDANKFNTDTELTISGPGEVAVTGSSATKHNVWLTDAARLNIRTSYYNTGYAENPKNFPLIHVEDGATLDVTGYPKDNEGGGSISLRLYLAGDGADGLGALYKGSSTDHSANGGISKVGIAYITLTDNASIGGEADGSAAFYMIPSGNTTHAAVLDLLDETTLSGTNRGYVLTKQGGNTFGLFNVDVKGGTLFVAEGTLSSSYNSAARDTDLVLRAGATLRLEDGAVGNQPGTGEDSGVAAVAASFNGMGFESLSGDGTIELGKHNYLYLDMNLGYTDFSSEFGTSAQAGQIFYNDRGYKYAHFSGIISDHETEHANTVTKAGSGTQWFMGSASDYHGQTTVEGGILYLTGTSTATSFAKASTEVELGVVGLSTLSWQGGKVYLGDGVRIYNNGECPSTVDVLGVEVTPTMTIGVEAITQEDGTLSYNEATYSGVLTSDGGMEKEGAGTLNVDQQGSFSGGTMISGGTLNLYGWASANDAVLTQSSGTTLMFSYDASYADESTTETIGADTQFALVGTGDARWLTDNSRAGDDGLTAALISDIGAAKTMEIAGIVSDGTENGATISGNVLHSGEGTLILSGANTYTGGTTVTAGTVIVAHDTGLGATAGGGRANLVTTLDSLLEIDAGVATTLAATTDNGYTGNDIRGTAHIGTAADGAEASILTMQGNGYYATRTNMESSATLVFDGTAASNWDGEPNTTGKTSMGGAGVLAGCGTVHVINTSSHFDTDETRDVRGSRVYFEVTDSLHEGESGFAGDLVVEGDNTTLHIQSGEINGGNYTVSGNGARLDAKRSSITVGENQTVSLSSLGDAYREEASTAVLAAHSVEVASSGHLLARRAAAFEEFDTQISVDFALGSYKTSSYRYHYATGETEITYDKYFASNKTDGNNRYTVAQLDTVGGLTMQAGSIYELYDTNVSLSGTQLTLNVTEDAKIILRGNNVLKEYIQSLIDADRQEAENPGTVVPTDQWILFSDVGSFHAILDGENLTEGAAALEYREMQNQIYVMLARDFLRTDCLQPEPVMLLSDDVNATTSTTDSLLDPLASATNILLIYDAGARVVYLDRNPNVYEPLEEEDYHPIELPVAVPEPTTTTLSLLALTALAARRRRR